jgi:hypothetical protein
MNIKNQDRYSLVEAYKKVQECDCQQGGAASLNSIPQQVLRAMGVDTSSNEEDRIDMILNNLVNINNKSAELVQALQVASNNGEEVEEWVAEKIAVVNSMIGSINDYYVKYSNTAATTTTQIEPTNGLNLQPSTVANSFPIKKMPAVIASF